MKTLPLFKSHYSLGRSILTLEKPTGKTDSYPISIFDLLIQHKLNILTLVDDNVGGVLQASKIAKENNIKFIFGLRIDVTDDCQNQNEDSLKKRAKYIVMAKNYEGYKAISKIWSFAAIEGFYYNPCIDGEHLKKFWTNDLKLVVPFYDSFLDMNAFHSHQHVPVFLDKPTFLIEDNDLPFDEFLKDKVVGYCKQNKFETLDAQSIYYKTSDDFLAYLGFRCLNNRDSNTKSTLDKPELDHMGSSSFNFDRWLKKQ